MVHWFTERNPRTMYLAQGAVDFGAGDAEPKLDGMVDGGDKDVTWSIEKMF